jgi:hypothetical protein
MKLFHIIIALSQTFLILSSMLKRKSKDQFIEEDSDFLEVKRCVIKEETDNNKILLTAPIIIDKQFSMLNQIVSLYIKLTKEQKNSLKQHFQIGDGRRLRLENFPNKEAYKHLKVFIHRGQLMFGSSDRLPKFSYCFFYYLTSVKKYCINFFFDVRHYNENKVSLYKYFMDLKNAEIDKKLQVVELLRINPCYQQASMPKGIFEFWESIEIYCRDTANNETLKTTIDEQLSSMMEEFVQLKVRLLQDYKSLKPSERTINTTEKPVQPSVPIIVGYNNVKDSEGQNPHDGVKITNAVDPSLSDIRK